MPAVSPAELKPGQRVRITQQVRVGRKSWPAVAEGVIREVQTLQTGLATDRNFDDIVAVATVHFMKDNRELSSVTVDGNTQIELL